MRGIRGLRQISARDLVLALRTGLDGFQTAPDRKVDGLIIADLEMQERMMLDRAPVAAEQRIGTDEIDGAGDPAALAPGHHQQHVLRHALAYKRKEGAGQIRPAPFARTGIHVEIEEGVPGILGEVAAGEGVNRNSISDGIAPLALDCLAMARVEGGEEILEAAVALVVPVKLLVVALQEAVAGQELRFGFARKCDVNR